MPLKNIGSLSPDAITALKNAKLLMVNRGNEVWIEDHDEPRAREVLKGIKDAVQQVYRLHGFIVKLPKEVALEQRWHGYPQRPAGRRGRIQIYECSKPANGINTDPKTKNLKKLTIRKETIEFKTKDGIEVPTPTFSPGYAGVIMTDDEGTPIFEVCPFNIFVLFDTRKSIEATRKVYEQMLVFALMMANHADETSVKVYNDIWKQQEGEREEFHIKQFEEMMGGSFKKELKTLENAVKVHEQTLVTLRDQTFKEERKLIETTQRYEAYRQSIAGGFSQKAKEEWEKLKGIENNGSVKNLRVTMDQINFTTRKIMWKPPKRNFRISPYGERQNEISVGTDEEIEIGEFEVSVSIGRDFHITITNLTKTLTYGGCHWHHPHIKEGSICRGNMTEALPKFAARRDFEAVIMCVLKWLQNVDTNDSWGTGIYYWIKDHRKKHGKKDAEKVKAS